MSSGWCGTLRRSRFSRPGLRLPEAEKFFLLDVLSNAGAADVPAMLEANRRLLEATRQLGGTLYPISAAESLPLPSGRGGRGRQ